LRDLQAISDKMFRIRVEDDFDASHMIPGHSKCKSLHGHFYKVEVFTIGEELDNNGILKDSDFLDLKRTLSDAVSKYDHKHLNDIIGNDTTAENIAKTIFKELKVKGINNLEKVRVWESPRNYAEYWE